MEIKTDPNVEGLIRVLKEHGIEKISGVVIDVNKGIFLEGVLPPGKDGERKRIIHFRCGSVDPTLFGCTAQLADEGLKILIQSHV